MPAPRAQRALCPGQVHQGHRVERVDGEGGGEVVDRRFALVTVNIGITLRRSGGIDLGHPKASDTPVGQCQRTSSAHVGDRHLIAGVDLVRIQERKGEIEVRERHRHRALVEVVDPEPRQSCGSVRASVHRRLLEERPALLVTRVKRETGRPPTQQDRRRDERIALCSQFLEGRHRILVVALEHEGIADTAPRLGEQIAPGTVALVVEHFPTQRLEPLQVTGTAQCGLGDMEHARLAEVIFRRGRHPVARHQHCGPPHVLELPARVVDEPL